MTLPNFNGQTWVAFSDLCGTKEMYKKNPNEAAMALDKFYNTVYSLQENQRNVCILVVSDCAIIWNHQDTALYEETCVAPETLEELLGDLRSLHNQMVHKDCLIRTTVAYGHFKYEQRLEMPRIRKNMIVGGAYLEAYTCNDQIRPGSIVIVKTPESGNSKPEYGPCSEFLTRAGDRKCWEFVWWVDDPLIIKKAMKKRENTYNCRFDALVKNYQNQEIE